MDAGVCESFPGDPDVQPSLGASARLYCLLVPCLLQRCQCGRSREAKVAEGRDAAEEEEGRRGHMGRKEGLGKLALCNLVNSGESESTVTGCPDVGLRQQWLQLLCQD